jgi:predicted HicB family RNase H-like nuclease
LPFADYWEKATGRRMIPADDLSASPNPSYSHERKESTVNDTITQNENFSGRCQKVLQVAKQLFQEKPDWVTFFRETLGVNGAARSVFANQQEYVLFEQSNEFSEIQTMVASLRTRKNSGGKNEPTRVITVRLPESLHEALKAEASDHNTSMNKLCISKLLQVLIENEKEAAAQRAAAAAPQAQRIAPQPPVAQPQQYAPQPASPPSSTQANFRSTYNPPSSNPPGQPRFGQ